MAGGRILFFSAPAASVRPRSPRLCCAGRMFCTCPPVARASRSRVDGRWRVLLLDDLQNMQDENDWNALCELIRSGADRRFVLLSPWRAAGACLIAFRYSEMEKYYRALPKAIR